MTRVELIRELRQHRFAPGLRPPALGGVGLIERGLLLVAAGVATNFRLDDTIDGGGIHYWESDKNLLETYSTNSVGFSSGQDILSKGVFDDRGGEVLVSIFAGNVDAETSRPAEYNGAVLIQTDDGLVRLAKKRA